MSNAAKEAECREAGPAVLIIMLLPRDNKLAMCWPKLLFLW
jgi:hypothetical protein